MTTVIFIPIKETQTKLIKLQEIAQKQLWEKHPLFFLAADKPSIDFLDKLLWSGENFLPHPTPFLKIGLELDPHYTTVFNLRPSAMTALERIKTIFEFEDHTSSERLQLSKQRYQTYRDQNFRIEYSVQF
ncbi:MAG TPA: DNA polymerase III subunit chi [Rhabdochlamydiaceae bacterium]|nr:DNA polymerase III subunit chi [Rhabdochlamydiaceae bacterium]